MADDQQIQIHLRRHYVEQAAARRPRLPGNLKQLGAVGLVVRPLARQSRQAFVQVRVTKGTTTGKHLSYLTHEKGPEKQDASLFGPGVVDKPQFVQAAQHDRHQFRLVLSAPEYQLVDQTQLTQLFMAQMERDLGRPLDWTVAHHSDTPHAHTHIVLRGQDRTGKDVYMERDYMTYGLRARAAQLMTWMLGPARQQQQFIQSDREISDGIVRSPDDPDNRARAQHHFFAANSSDQQPPQTREVNRQGDALAAVRLAAQSRPEVQPARPVPQPDTGAGLARFAAGLAALQHALQAQEQARQRGQGMGF